MPSVRRIATDAASTKAELVVVGVYEGNVLSDAAKQVDRRLKGELAKHLSRARPLGFKQRKLFKGRIFEATSLGTLGKLPAAEIMAVGLGPRENVSHEEVRRAAGTAGRLSGGYRSVSLHLSGESPTAGPASIEGFCLGAYSFSKYLTQKPKLTSSLLVEGATKAEIDRAMLGVDASCWARDIVNEYPSMRGPKDFAEMAGAFVKESGGKIEIWDATQLAKQGMNGILAVGRGSSAPPCFAILRWNPKPSRDSLILVGKGITFDSGGLSLKSLEGMQGMKFDCAGAAAVAGAVAAAARAELPLAITGVLALAENLPGPTALRVGDVITHYGGKTSEVLNTDAEGRLVLADALAWASAQSPSAVVDLATLTGAMVVSLGHKWAGLFSNRDDLARELIGSSARSGESIWRMPLIEDYHEKLESNVADLRNSALSSYGASIFAALFLREFVGGTPWAHIDIAGPAYADEGRHYLPAGGTGFGVRTLIDWMESRASRL